MKYERVPHRVRAEPIDTPWGWTTANGDVVIASAGDFRVTDPETGNQWSITPAALRSGYLTVGGGVYESRGSVTARQVIPGEHGESVVSLEGLESARPGDWVVTDADGNEWVVEDHWFKARYRPRDAW